MVFNTFSFEPTKKEIFLVYREVPEFSEITNRPSSSSPLSVSPTARRTPPVDLIHGASATKWTQGSSPAPPGLPLGTSPRGHAPLRPSRAATPPRHAARRLLAPPARRRVAPDQIDLPQTPIASPRCSPAYKEDPRPAVARLSLLLPPSAVHHGQRDLARVDQPSQPRIAPSNHPSSFATPQLSSMRAESSPNLFPSPFPFRAAAGELGLIADRPTQRETVHESYPRRFLTLSQCSCVRRSSTPSPASPTPPATELILRH